ncbi:MAG: hypothetical protein ACXWTN_05380 [Methylosarcina sp.]
MLSDPQREEFAKEVLSALPEFIQENIEPFLNFINTAGPSILNRMEQIKKAQEEANRVLDLLEKGTLQDFNNLSVSGLAVLIVCNGLDEKGKEEAKKLLYQENSEKGVKKKRENIKDATDELLKVYDKKIDKTLPAPKAVEELDKIYAAEGRKPPFTHDGRVKKIRKERNKCGYGKK